MYTCIVVLFNVIIVVRTLNHRYCTLFSMTKPRGGYRISEKGGLLINNKTSVGGCCPLSADSTSGGGGGGGGGCCPLSADSTSGGGCCPRACETQGFKTKEGVVNPKTP